MRTYLLIFATVGLLSGVFIVYWRSQPPTMTQTPASQHPIAPPPAPTTQGSAPSTPYREGSRPWVTMLDKDGKIASRYRAQEYLPQKDGTVHLIRPEADFYMGNHERLHVTGVDGDVVMGAAPTISLDTTGGQSSGPPRRGRLHTVTMTLMDDAAVAGPATVLTMKTNNIDFDNDTFLITTGGFTDPQGKLIPADQVPVQVRGEYDFDGRGLTLRWNDRDDRLELLEIAHGEELRILHPSQRNGPGNAVKTTPGADTQPAAPPVAPPPANPPAPVANAGDNSSRPPTSSPATHPAVASTQPVKPPKPTYVATFQENVRITQGAQSLITADTMRVHFRLKEEETQATTRPSDAAPTAPDQSAKGQAPPNTNTPSASTPKPAASPESPTVASSSPPPTTAPTTAPAEEIPVVVHWTGTLRIVPEATAPPRPVGPGDAIMELVGLVNPVRIFRGAVEDAPASQIQCTNLLYMTADGGAFLSSSKQFGQVQIVRKGVEPMGDEDPLPPTLVNADTVDYGGPRRKTTLGSNGEAVIPLAGNPGEKPTTLDAKWADRAEFEFFPHGGDEMAIRSAKFYRDVHIRHPQLDLDSQQLTLLFSASTPSAGKTNTGSALSDITAAERVHCRLADSAGKQQTVDCAWLDLHTATGSDRKVFARQIDAAGNALAQVHASDGTQDLFCDRVRMFLRPAAKATTQPDAQPQAGIDTSSVELESMDARGNVDVRSNNGSNAKSDELLVSMSTDGPHVMFTGDKLSKLMDAKRNVLSGSKIVMQPRQQLAHVIGPGTLHVVGEPAQAGKSATRPMDVIWSDGADLDGGAGNQINLRGGVVATMPDSDGTIDTSHSQFLRIDLMPKVAAATQPAVRRPPTTRPSEDMDVFHDKEASRITLETPDGYSIVDSTLADAQGVLRQSRLQAPRIIYAVAATADQPAHSLLVPSPGKMLVRDHRPPAPDAKKEDDPSGLGGGRGATAFQWAKSLLYNEDTRQAIMKGGVKVVHQSDDPKELPVELQSDQITANFQPAGGGKKPATTQPGGPESAMEMKNMEALGNVLVTRGPMQITSNRLYFVPATHWMTFDGTERNPVSVTDEKGTQTGDEVRWNTVTWDFVIKGASGIGVGK